MEPLRVLMYSQRFPFPMDTGGKIRTGQLLKRLHQRFHITLITNMEEEKDRQYIDEVATLCSEYHAIGWKEVPKFSPKFFMNVLLRLFSARPITVLNDYSQDVERKLHDLIMEERFDLVICDFLQPSINFEHIRTLPSILFEHNVEYVIPQRHYLTSRNPLLRWFWRSQWKKMERYEKEACQNFSGVIAVSVQDRDCLRALTGKQEIFSIPTGVDTQYFMPTNGPCEKHTLVFSGSMDWIPNEDGISYFISDILPLIQAQIRDVRLTVVGRNPTPGLQKLAEDVPQVRFLGRVEDVRPYIAQAEVYIVPLRIGGGTRIKIFEAMAMGKAVVSTSIGAEGLPVISEKNCLLADSPEDFAQAVVTLLHDSEKRRSIERAARKFVEDDFTWEKVSEVFSDICQNIAGKS
ncbi:MAG: glycosyltransferase [Nitrospirales bacterium]|nr:glycosyltransferase [Nitrospira sp.]MDR4501932.1 glycosyltransferase [Nitrospirales bacterium]